MKSSFKKLSFNEKNSTIEVLLNKLQLNAKKESHVFKEYHLINLNQTKTIIRWENKDNLTLYIDIFDRKKESIDLYFGIVVRNILENCTEIDSEMSVGKVEIPKCESKI